MSTKSQQWPFKGSSQNSPRRQWLPNCLVCKRHAHPSLPKGPRLSGACAGVGAAQKRASVERQRCLAKEPWSHDSAGTTPAHLISLAGVDRGGTSRAERTTGKRHSNATRQSAIRAHEFLERGTDRRKERRSTERRGQKSWRGAKSWVEERAEELRERSEQAEAREALRAVQIGVDRVVGPAKDRVVRFTGSITC